MRLLKPVMANWRLSFFSYSSCSVVCCKEHKTQACEPPKESSEKRENVSERGYEFPTDDTVPVEKLRQLRHSEELKQCLRNPHVRDIMKSILNNPDPTAAIALAMTEPIFVEVADACLKIVEPPDNAKPCWVRFCVLYTTYIRSEIVICIKVMFFHWHKM